MTTKTCKQCGLIKPLDQYRRYYGGRKGTYTMCKQCEKINAREKYLVGKGEQLNTDEAFELEKIHKLWELQAAKGLQPPNRRERRTALIDDLDSMLERYTAEPVDNTDTPMLIAAPAEISRWFTATLDCDPDYYLDEIYEALKAKYMPVLYIDQQTMMPVYDTKYKDVLDRLLERFNAYEDEYYNNEE